MKFLKKSILLLSILAAFTVSCTKAQNSLNSSFDVVEDGTSKPSNPPVDITPNPADERKDFPSEAELYIKSTNYTIDQFNSSYSIEFVAANANKDVIDLLKRTKDKRHTQVQKTVVSRTENVASVDNLLDSVYITTDHLNGSSTRNVLNIAQGAYDALGSKGQYANMKIEIFIEDTKEITDSTGYKPGSRTLWVTIKRNN